MTGKARRFRYDRSTFECGHATGEFKSARSPLLRWLLGIQSPILMRVHLITRGCRKVAHSARRWHSHRRLSFLGNPTKPAMRPLLALPKFNH